MSSSERAESVDSRMAALRSSISDLAHEINVNKTKTAAALGGGVFALLLAAGAAYDLLQGKAAAWSMVGVTRSTLILITIALAAAAIMLLTVGFVRIRRRDSSADLELEQMEEEYAELLEVKRRTE
jgi:hypothetical protein